MEWAIPPNLQYTTGGLQVPTKRKQLTGVWDRMDSMIRPTLQASRLPFPTYNPRVEGFQVSNTIDQALGAELRDFISKYNEAQKVLNDKEIPQDTKDFLAYYESKLEKRTDGSLVGFNDSAYVEFVDDSKWDQAYLYYRFIFSDPSKCVKSSNTSSPAFTFEFQKLGKPVLSTYSDDTRATYTDAGRSFPVLNGIRQKYANGVLLVQLDAADTFSGYSWGADNKGRKDAPILSTWLLQASNDSTVWEDLNVADVFNELVQQDTARFALLDDTRQRGAVSGTFKVFSKERMRKDIDMAKRRLLQGLIDKFRVTYIQLPPTLQNLLVQQFAQTDLDRSDAMNTSMTSDRLDALFTRYLQTSQTTGGAPSVAGTESTQQFVLAEMMQAIRSNLQSSIPAIQQATASCRAPTGAPSSTITAQQSSADLAKLQATGSQAITFQELTTMFLRYNDILNSMTENMSSASRNAQLQNIGDNTAALFAIPTNLPKDSFADKTYNEYRAFLTRKLAEFYDKFMFEEVIESIPASTGAPTAATTSRKIKATRYYTNYYNEDIRDLYKTDRTTGISKGRADYLAIWKERDPGVTPESHIVALQELDYTYDNYAAILDASIPIAKQRKQTIDMIDLFKYCYDKIVQKFASIRSEMILEGSVDTDRSNALLIQDLSDLVGLYEKYYGYIYNHSIQGVGNQQERNDLWTRLGNLIESQTGIQKQFSDLYNKVIREEFTTTYAAFAGKQYNAYKRQIGTETDGRTTYTEATQTLFQELETTWKLPEKTKPTYVFTNLLAYTNYLQSAINTLKATKVLKKTKSSEFSTDTERQSFNSMDAALNIFIEWYGYLFAAKDALDPADPSQKGIGFLSRVEQSIELDSIRPRTMILMNEYNTVYDAIIPAITNIATKPFISKLYNTYDLSEYGVNEMNILATNSLMDIYDLSSLNALSGSETEVPISLFYPNPTNDSAFDINYVRITGGVMTGSLDRTISYTTPGTRITRYSIAANEAIFLLSDDFEGGRMKMIQVKVRYDPTSKKLFVSLVNNSSKSRVNWRTSDDTIPPTSFWIFQDAKTIYDTNSESASSSFGIKNLKLGYIKFYKKEKVNSDITWLKNISIFDKTTFATPTNLTPSSANTNTNQKVYSDNLITEIQSKQSKYYLRTGGKGTGYYQNLLTYMSEITKAYIAGLKKIHEDFDTLLGTTGDGLYNTDWGNKREFSIYMEIINYSNNNLEKWTGNFADNFKANYESSINMINGRIASERINGIILNSEKTFFIAPIGELMTSYYNLYKPAMNIITNYNYWKCQVRGWITGNKTNDFGTELNNAATFYADADYGGTAREFRPGRYTSTDLGNLKGTFSSAKIKAGFRVYAFELDNFQGECKIWDASGSNEYAIPSFDNSWNNRIQSMFVYFGVKNASFDKMYDVYYTPDNCTVNCFTNNANNELNTFRRQSVADVIMSAETEALANNAKSNIRFLFDKDQYLHNRRDDLITVFTNWFNERQTTETKKIEFNNKYDTMVSGGYNINQDIPTNTIRNFKNENFSYADNKIDDTSLVKTNRTLSQDRINFLNKVIAAQVKMNEYITKYADLIKKNINLGGEITNYQNSFAYTTFDDITEGTNPRGPTWNMNDAITKNTFLDKVDAAQTAKDTFMANYNEYIKTVTFGGDIEIFARNFTYTKFDNSPITNKDNSIIYNNYLNNIVKPVVEAKKEFNTTYDNKGGVVVPQFIIDFRSYKFLSTSFLESSTIENVNKCNVYEAYVRWLIKLNEIQDYHNKYKQLYDMLTKQTNTYYVLAQKPDTLASNFVGGTGSVLETIRTQYPFTDILTKQELQMLRYQNKGKCFCSLVKDDTIVKDVTTYSNAYASDDRYINDNACSNGKLEVHICTANFPINEKAPGMYVKIITHKELIGFSGITFETLQTEANATLIPPPSNDLTTLRNKSLDLGYTESQVQNVSSIVASDITTKTDNLPNKSEIIAAFNKIYKNAGEKIQGMSKKFYDILRQIPIFDVQYAMTNEFSGISNISTDTGNPTVINSPDGLKYVDIDSINLIDFTTIGNAFPSLEYTKSPNLIKVFGYRSIDGAAKRFYIYVLNDNYLKMVVYEFKINANGNLTIQCNDARSYSYTNPLFPGGGANGCMNYWHLAYNRSESKASLDTQAGYGIEKVKISYVRNYIETIKKPIPFNNKKEDQIYVFDFPDFSTKQKIGNTSYFDLNTIEIESLRTAGTEFPLTVYPNHKYPNDVNGVRLFSKVKSSTEKQFLYIDDHNTQIKMINMSFTINTNNELFLEIKAKKSVANAFVITTYNTFDDWMTYVYNNSTEYTPYSKYKIVGLIISYIQNKPKESDTTLLEARLNTMKAIANEQSSVLTDISGNQSTFPTFTVNDTTTQDSLATQANTKLFNYFKAYQLLSLHKNIVNTTPYFNYPDTSYLIDNISISPSTSAFQNQNPYSKPQVQRKILINSLNNLDFSGSPVVSYTFQGFLQSLQSWFTR